jgi:hypothetical protein
MTEPSIGQKILAAIILVPLALGGAIGLMSLIGAIVDGIGEHNQQREQCLKQATTGWEIERCR